jgi:threonine synthase
VAARYVSTRGVAPELGFGDVLLAGLATDGGLYVPAEWPTLEPGWDAPGRPYADVAVDVMWPYVDGSMEREDLVRMVGEAYATFDHPDVCPVVELGDLHLLELFWGPTLAFKDVALQLVGRLFDHELTARGERATIVVATSGDTGSAAIEACVGRDTLDIVVLHPEGRVSDVQRKQMTTVDAPNVHNVAITGTFDDCQDLVKACFADVAFRDRVRLSAMNSINWARVMAQVVYYATTVARLGRASFAVPTGNFGNIFSGWIAERMGVPIDQLVIGSNSNDILTRWVESGSLVAQEVVPTWSPSMDIQVSSNHERLLFELLGRDGDRTADLLTRFRGVGSVEVPRDPRFDAARVDDAATLEVIRDVYEQHGVLVDPHTAVGIGAARACRRDPAVPMVCLATAHPAKFPDAVERATGVRPPLPARLGDLSERSERYDVLPADLAQVQAYVTAAVAHR